MRPLIKSTNNTDKTQKIKTKMQNSKDTLFFTLSKRYSWHIFTQFFKKFNTRAPLIMRVCTLRNVCLRQRLICLITFLKVCNFPVCGRKICDLCVWLRACVCMCVCVLMWVRTPSPPLRCSSSLQAVVFSSRQAWPGSPPSSPSGFCRELRLSARESGSTRQPSTGGLDTQTHRKTAVRIPQMDRFSLSYCFIKAPTEKIKKCSVSLPPSLENISSYFKKTNKHFGRVLLISMPSGVFVLMFALFQLP